MSSTPKNPPNPVTFSKDTPTSTLLTIWKNQKSSLEKIAKTIDDGTFHKAPDTKGACPPSQAGQLNLWIAMGVDIELTRRGVPH